MRALRAALIVSVLALAIFAFPSGHAARPNSASSSTGAVFVLSNNATANSVIAYARNSTGALSWVANFSTGG
ncbi:MAG: hypothetical protein L3J96_01220, partial [Thermoplasmata archaeon]|nr:hypothetical protein [Thermoplasmata archaeon]